MAQGISHKDIRRIMLVRLHPRPSCPDRNAHDKARPGEIVATQDIKDRLGDKLLTARHWRENLKGIGNTAIYRVVGIQ